MIFVTGDTHGDLHRFDNPVVKKMKKEAEEFNNNPFADLLKNMNK